MAKTHIKYMALNGLVGFCIGTVWGVYAVNTYEPKVDPNHIEKYCKNLNTSECFKKSLNDYKKKANGK